MKQPRDIAERTRQLRDLLRVDPDGFHRETFTLLSNMPAQGRVLSAKRGIPTTVENWHQLPDGQIEFTLQRLLTAD